MQVDVKYAMVSEEGYVSWLTERQAEIAGGYGATMFSIEEHASTEGAREPIYVVDVGCFYQPDGMFRLMVNLCDVEDAVLAAHAALESLGDKI